MNGSEIEFHGKIRVQIADILHKHYSSYEHGFNEGQERIDPLPDIVREIFGSPRLTHYPQYPQKKIRDFVDGLSSKEILLLLSRLTKDDGFQDFNPVYESYTDQLTNSLNEILEKVGIRLTNGEIIHSIEGSLRLIEDEKSFLTILDDLEFIEIKNSYEGGIRAFREGDLLKASSLCCLALDSILKTLIIKKGGSLEKESLGKLINIAVELNIIEEEAQTIFSSFVSLRNKAPQHASSTGEIEPLSSETTMLLIHMSRILTTYLIERFYK